MLVELRDVQVAAVVALGLLELVGVVVLRALVVQLLEELSLAQLELALVLVVLRFASFAGPTWALVA